MARGGSNSSRDFSRRLASLRSLRAANHTAVRRFDLGKFPINCEVASEVMDFEPKDWFTNFKSVKSNDRYTHFAVAASKMAMSDANLEIGEKDVVGRVVKEGGRSFSNAGFALVRLGGRLAFRRDDWLRLWRRRNL